MSLKSSTTPLVIQDANQNNNTIGLIISGLSGETRIYFFIFQRLSIVLLRYNAILVHESFYEGDEPDQ